MHRCAPHVDVVRVAEQETLDSKEVAKRVVHRLERDVEDGVAQNAPLPHSLLAEEREDEVAKLIVVS